MKSIFVLLFTLVSASAWALDCSQLGRAVEAATNTCESKVADDDLDGYSSCFDKEVERVTSLSVGEVEHRLLECSRKR